MSAPEKKPHGDDAHTAEAAGAKAGLLGKLLAPLQGVKSMLAKVGRIGALFGAVFGIIPKALGWAKGHKLIAIVALVVILVVTNGAIWFSLAEEGPPPPPPITIQDALKALDDGNYPKAREIAQSLETVAPSDFDTWGGVPFVLATCDLYERETADKAPTLIEDAQVTAVLQTARDRGFPAGREAQGHYLLGRCLERIGQYADAREVLEKSLVYGAPPKAVCLPLAEAWSVDPRPDFPRARSYLNDYLNDDSLTDVERQWGLIELARQQLAQGDLPAAQKTLASFKPGESVVPASRLMDGRIALAKARAFQVPAEGADRAARQEEQKQLYQASIDLFRQVTPRDRSSIPWQRLGVYFVGAALAEMGDAEGAIRQFSRLRMHFSNSYEALVAGLDQAELLRKQGKDEEAIGLMAAVLREVPPEVEIDHPHLPDLAPAQKVRENYDGYMRKRDFTAAIKMVNAGEPVLGAEATWQLRAEVYEQWAQARFMAAAEAPFEDRESIAADGRRRMRQAGAAYKALAAIHFSDRRYPDDLWKSAECFDIGRDYDAAIEEYREYIEFNTPRRRAEALIGLSGALLASGRAAEALEAVTEAIRTYPRNPGVYAARLLASNIYVELGEGPKAEEMLLANIEGGQLAPESNEWRDSLFALGTLLYREGRPADALPRLNEAVRRWPDLPQSEGAHYLIAECHRLRAEELRAAANATSVPSERSQRMRDVDANLVLALDHYDKVRDQLEQRSDRELLPPIDQATLRNCYFGRGGMLQQLGRYEDALQAYADASNRYQFAPEALVAYVQSAECLRQLRRMEEAKVAVEQAKVALARIPADADFPATTSRTRAEWQQELDWLSKNL